MERLKIHIQSKKQRVDAKTTNLDKRPKPFSDGTPPASVGGLTKIGIKCKNTFDIGNRL